MKMYEQKRQHPLMIPLASLRGTLIILVPMIFVFIQNLDTENLLRNLLLLAGSAVLILTVVTVLQVLSWAFYTYRYEAGYLHIKSGVVFKKERSIKRERVQTVNIRRGIVQRLFGLASLQVETAGGGSESELSLTAVTLEEAYSIKRSLEGMAEDYASAPGDTSAEAGETAGKEAAERKETAHRAGLKGLIDTAIKPGPGMEEAQGDETGAVYRITTGELFLAGATSGGFFVLFSVIGLVFSQALPFIPDAFWDYLLEQVTSTATGTVVLVVMVLLFISWFISSLAFMVQYANFTLQRRHDRLLVTWGLIEQKQLALNLNRLQALGVHEGILRQPFGRCALVAEVAGGGSSDQNYITLLFPLLRTAELNQFFSRVLPEYRMPETFTPLPARAMRRYIFRAVAPTLLVIVPLQWVPYGWLSFFLLIPAVLWGYSRYRAGGTALDERQMTLRFRFVNRFQVIKLRKHIQAFQVSVNPFQRWWGLRSVRAWVLSSPSGKAFQVTDVEEKEARRIWGWYSRSN